MKRASTAKSSKSGRLKTTGGSGRRSRNNKTGTVTPSRDALLETEDEVAEQHRRALEDVKQQLTREKFKVTQLLNKQRTDEHRHKDEIRQIKARGHELGDRLAIAEARWKKFSSVEYVSKPFVSPLPCLVAMLWDDKIILTISEKCTGVCSCCEGEGAKERTTSRKEERKEGQLFPCFQNGIVMHV